MIGSFITRGLLLIFGYVYPAYECYKTVEMNKPNIDELRFWCQYWILVAGLTVCERIGDMFVGWLPMYGEAKLAFLIYLWFPKTKGTTYVYDSFFRPYVAKHETEIDRNLFELRSRAGDIAVLYWQKAASYGQTRIFEILQYIASQSNPPRPAQPQQQGNRVPKPSVPSNRGSAAATLPLDEQPSSASRTSSSKQQDDTTEEAVPSEDSKENTAPTTLNEQKTTSTLPLVNTSKSSTSNEGQATQSDSVPPAANGISQPPPPETFLEGAVRLTRARFRTLAGSNH